MRRGQSFSLSPTPAFPNGGRLLNDEVLASALLDRLLHHVEVISISGKSFRMKDHITKGEKQKAALS